MVSVYQDETYQIFTFQPSILLTSTPLALRSFARPQDSASGTYSGFGDYCSSYGKSSRLSGLITLENQEFFSWILLSPRLGSWQWYLTVCSSIQVLPGNSIHTASISTKLPSSSQLLLEHWLSAPPDQCAQISAPIHSLMVSLLNNEYLASGFQTHHKAFLGSLAKMIKRSIYPG
jgi:hypothetical protein